MLSSVFYDIYNGFKNLAYQFLLIADWLEEQGWPWNYLAGPFNLLKDACTTIANFFYDCYTFAQGIEEKLNDAWSKAEQVFNYAYDVLYYEINDALNAAAYAWDWAVSAYNLAASIADVIGTTFSQIVSFIQEYANIIYETITNYITNVYETVYNTVTNVYETITNYITNVYETITNYITNVYETIHNYIDNSVTQIIGVTVDIVNDLIAAALAAIAGPINLVNFWFDDIQSFFTSPLDWLESRLGDWFLGKEK